MNRPDRTRAMLLAAASVLAISAEAQTPSDHRVPSRPDTVVWGEIPIERPPVLTIRSGATVTVDTLSHAGATQDEHPVSFLAKHGIAKAEVLQDVLDFWASRPRQSREGWPPHILTGPIYVDGAAAGDMLEIQVLDLTLRTQYGLNGSAAPSGVLSHSYPGTRPGDPPPPARQRVVRTRIENGRGVADVTPNVVVPLRPFMGIIAVAPPLPRIGQPGITADGVQTSRPPGPYGGNLDYKDLGPGSRLFLPVFQSGARVYFGDPHSAQGDGEVNGNAIEHSLTGRFRLILHKGKALNGPRAETATHYVMMGIDVDLDRALRLATAEVIDFLTAEKGLSPADAYTLASIACDFHVAEAVDLTQVVVGKIPKDVFR